MNPNAARHLSQQLVKMPYPPLVRRQHYIVLRGKGKVQQTLYSGPSHDVARLIVNTMPGASLLEHINF